MWITIFGHLNEPGHGLVTRSRGVLFDFEGLDFWGGLCKGSCNMLVHPRGCKQIINMHLARDDDDAFLYGEPAPADEQTALLASSGKTARIRVSIPCILFAQCHAT